MPTQCDALKDDLARLAGGEAATDDDTRRHVEQCLRCQAEMVQYRRLLRLLHNLRTEVLEPAPGLVTEVLAHIEAAGERRAIRSLLTGRRAAYVAAATAATAAAGAAGVIVLTRRGGARTARRLAS